MFRGLPGTRGGWIGLLTALLLLSVTTPAAATASTAHFPYELSIKGAYGTADVLVAIPDGTRPVGFTGRIESSYTTAGDLLVIVDGRVAASVPAKRGGGFQIRLNPADVHDGELAVGLRADLEPDRNCFRDDLAVASVVDPQVELDRSPEPASTIAGFLAPGSASFVVAVPAAPTPAEQTAGLDVALALRHIAQPSTAIDLQVTDSPPPTTAERRTVVVNEVPAENNSLSITDGRLVISGGDQALTDAATSVADPNTSLLDVAQVHGLPGYLDHNPITAAGSLTELGIDSLSVRGIGRVSQVVTIAQAAFGAPVSQFIVKLVGAATPVLPGQQGRVNVRWNDQLVVSRALTQDSRLTLSFTVASANLRSVNYLDLELEYLPAGGECSNPPLPGEVALDVQASTLTPTFGTSAGPGFQRFPQVFESVIPVATGGPLADSLPDLAAVLDAAVMASPLQYRTELVDAGSLAGRGAVGAGLSSLQAGELAAPVPAQQDDPGFPAGAATSYAALQAFQSAGSNLIVLSGDSRSATDDLARWVEGQPGGWSALTGEAYVLAEGQSQPQAFVTASTEPDKRTPQIIAAAVVTVILLLALAIWLRRRPAGG